MSTTCPVCKSNDQIMKVSAIVSSGTSTHSSYGAATSMDKSWKVSVTPVAMGGTSTTQLAQRLSPPAKPQAKRGWGCAFIFFVLLGIYGFVGVVMRNTPGAFAASIVMVLVGIFAAVATKDRAFYLRTEQYKSDKEAWETAIKCWNQLYYCFRDDVVFNPSSGAHTGITEWHRLLR